MPINVWFYCCCSYCWAVVFNLLILQCWLVNQVQNIIVVSNYEESSLTSPVLRNSSPLPWPVAIIKSGGGGFFFAADGTAVPWRQAAAEPQEPYLHFASHISQSGGPININHTSSLCPILLLLPPMLYCVPRVCKNCRVVDWKLLYLKITNHHQFNAQHGAKLRRHCHKAISSPAIAQRSSIPTPRIDIIPHHNRDWSSPILTVTEDWGM